MIDVIHDPIVQLFLKCSFLFISLVTNAVQARVGEKEAEEEEDRRLKEEEEKAKAALLPVEKKGK